MEENDWKEMYVKRHNEEQVEVRSEWLLYKEHGKWHYIGLIPVAARTDTYQAKIDYVSGKEAETYIGMKKSVREEVTNRNERLFPRDITSEFHGKLRFVYRRLAPGLEGWILEECVGAKKFGGKPEVIMQKLKELLK